MAVFMEKNQLKTSEIMELINSLTEENNYIEILQGYCESNLEHSDELNIIYPIIETIRTLHKKNSEKAKFILYG